MPPEFRELVTATAQDLLGKFPRTLALVIIGSVAEGGFRPESNLEVIWVVRGPLRRTWWREIEHPPGCRVQVIPWLRQAMDTALHIHREDRWMSWAEAQQVVYLVRWLRSKLEEDLG